MPEEQSGWHREVLPAGWARAVGELAARSVVQGFYLAGGTGLALHFGHWRSGDLDLFRDTEFTAADLRDRLRDLDGLRKLEWASLTQFFLSEVPRLPRLT